MTRAARRGRLARRCKRTGRLLTVAAAGVGLLLGAAVAAAQQVTLPVSGEAWFHHATAGTLGPLGEDVPEQPPDPTVPPDSLPAGLRNSEHAYRSALRFDLTVVPKGALVSTFVVTMRQTTEVGALPGVEACALTAPFPEGPNQPMDRLPRSDCIFSGSGVHRQDDPDTPAEDESSVWTFDLTDTAQAWVSGQIANHGLVVQFTAPENLPVGQPDPAQSSGRVTWAGQATRTPPQATLAYSVAPAGGGASIPPPPPAAAPAGPPQSTAAAPSGQPSGGLTFGSAPALEPAFEPAPALEPAVAAPGEPAEPPAFPAAAPLVAGGPRATLESPPPVAVAAREPETPLYVWLLVPIGLAAMYVLTRSLTAEPQLARAREGAVTRLMQRRRAESARW